MRLLDIADNESVFVDSNIFIYHFSKFEKLAAPCLDFFQKIEDGLISGYTSTFVLAEVLHRLMVIEASRKLNIPPGKVIRRLKNNPEKISSLSDHLKSVDCIEKIGISILPVTAHELKESIGLKVRYGLLTIDAVNLSVMNNDNITAIASNDADYDRVEFLNRYSP